MASEGGTCCGLGVEGAEGAEGDDGGEGRGVWTVAMTGGRVEGGGGCAQARGRGGGTGVGCEWCDKGGEWVTQKWGCKVRGVGCWETV